MATSAPKQYPMAWKYCGNQIKLWREKAGVTREQLAAASHYDIESVRSMEAGRRRPSLKLLTAAEDLCDARGMLLAALPYLAPESTPTRSDAYREVEDEMVALYSYESLYIPGLMQTEGYARALLGHTMPPVDDATVEQNLEVRLRRQERLKQPTVLFSFTIYEAALHTLIGGEEIMRGQLLRLLEFEHSRSIRTQVIPIGHAVPSALSGSLVIMETINNEQYAYVETHGTNALHSDPCLVGELSRRHAMIRAQALNVRDSVRLIRKTLEQL